MTKLVLFAGLPSVFLFTLDRLLKIVCLEKLSAGGGFFVLADWLKIEPALNRGAVFGLSVWPSLIVGFYVLAIFWLFWFLILAARAGRLALSGFLSFVVAGAFSNFFDRFYFGAVVDYFNLMNLTVFNLADAMIVGGVIGLIILSLKTGAEPIKTN